MAKIVRIRLWDLQAGDILIVKQGTIRKQFHICEVTQHGSDNIHYVYKDHGKYVHNDGDHNDIVRVRD
jgi:hypothetical protein